VERLELRGFDLAEVREQLSRMAVSDSEHDARVTLDLTGGNPLFVREVARAMADGTWRPDRPPRSVLDVVGHGSTASPRDFPLPLVARALDEQPVAQCLPVIDEAIAYGLVDCVSHIGDYRFVHALTREAVEASLTTADRTALHRAVAAVRRLAFEEGARLYRAALALPATPPSAIDRCRVLIALGRAAYFAGDLQGCLEKNYTHGSVNLALTVNPANRQATLNVTVFDVVTASATVHESDRQDYDSPTPSGRADASARSARGENPRDARE